MSRRHLLMLFVLAAIWGSSFMFIKVAVRDLAPADVVWGRLLVGTLVLLPAVPFLLGGRRLLPELRPVLGPLTLLAAANAALPFWLLTWSERRLDSGLAAVLQASTPLFAALFALGWSRGNRVSGARLVGVFVGFGGVLLLVGAQPRGDVLSALAVLLSAACYAAAALYAGTRLADVPPVVIAIGTLMIASIIMMPLGIAQLPSHAPGWKAIASVVALGAAGLSVAYVLYFGIITGAGASYAVLVTYLVPALALVYGALLLDEPVTATGVGGLALILVGVGLGTGTLRLPRRTPVGETP